MRGDHQGLRRAVFRGTLRIFLWVSTGRCASVPTLDRRTPQGTGTLIAQARLT